MVKAKLLPVLPLVLIIITVLLAAGCSGGETTTPAAETTTTQATTTSPAPFTEQELKQILLDSKEAMIDAQTYQLDMNLNTDYSIDNKDSGGTSMTGAITFDVPNNQMVMSFEMTTEPGAGASVENLKADLYVLTEYIYMKFNIPEIGEQWVKARVTEEILDNFNANMIQEEMAGMELPTSVNFVKYETIRDADCYVIEYLPDDEYLQDYAEQQLPPGLTINWDKVSSIKDLFQNMSFKTWIAKDTKYIMKMEISGTVVFTSDFTEGISFDKATTTVNGVIELHDYNATVTIEPPEEAENAIEISPDMFLGQ